MYKYIIRYSQFLLGFALLFGFLCNSCHPTTLESLNGTQGVSSLKVTSVPPDNTPTPFTPIFPTYTPSPPSLPSKFLGLKIDGQQSTAEYYPELNAWIWKDKKGVFRRLFDPLSGHVLVRTSIGNDRLTYEIDYAFKWEVNLVNYLYYPTHAPLGSAYINLLKLKHPEIFSRANDQTGIIFRILQTGVDELSSSTQPVTLLDEGTERERFFLKPAYLPASNEYLFVMGLKADFLTRKGAINTYTEEMLSYCITPNEQINPSGSWGIEVYKHAIK